MAAVNDGDGGAAPAATFELTDASRRDREEQERLLRELELRRRVRTTVVPTDDGKVRAMLRELAEPVTLFGEKEMERRERLRRLIAEREAAGEGVTLEGQPIIGQLVVEEVVGPKELFYTEGTEELRLARRRVAEWSLPRAAARVAAARRLLGGAAAAAEGGEEGGGGGGPDLPALKALDAAWTATERAAKRLGQLTSELGDDRPIGALAFSADGAALATCGWGGNVALWAADAGCRRLWAFRAAPERLTGLAWHPDARPTLPHAPHGGADGDALSAAAAAAPGTVALATGCADGSAALWSEGGTQLRRLEGHTARLGRVAFHPMGLHLATASYDGTWRLWDVETGGCLVEQEGHSRGVYAVAFHPDGSLAASAGLDAYARVWDCRTGRGALVLGGHAKQVLAVDFSPDGVRVATGGDDHAVKVWDLRKRGSCVYTIPAHTSLVSTVRWQPGHGRVLLTAGFDCSAKLWSGRDFRLLRVLSGHEGKVMAADLAPPRDDSAAGGAGAGAGGGGASGGGCGLSGEFELLVASGSYDRLLKTWSPQRVDDVIASTSGSSGGSSGSSGSDDDDDGDGDEGGGDGGGADGMEEG